MPNWDEAGSGAISGALTGASLGSAVPGVGTAIGAAAGGLVGGAIGLFSDNKAPQFTDPNADRRRVLEDNLLSAKTGEEYAAHASAMNEHRGQSMYDEVSKDFSGNPAVSSSIYNNIERGVENENTTAGIEGARINQDNQREAANMMSQDSSRAQSIFDDNANRAGRPSVFDQVASSGLTQLAGDAIGNLGAPKTADAGDDPGSPPDIGDAGLGAIGGGTPGVISGWDGVLPGMGGGRPLRAATIGAGN